MYDNFLNQLNVEGVGAVVAAPDEVSTFTIEIVDFYMPPAALGKLRTTKNGFSTLPNPLPPNHYIFCFKIFVSKFICTLLARPVFVHPIFHVCLKKW